MFSNPLKNLKALGLRENEIIADLGAGTGFYSVLAGHLVPRGKVYAVEINQDYLGTIKRKVKDAHLSNVEILWGNIEKAGGTKLRDATADVVIASNLISHLEKPKDCILEIKRILKARGRVLFIDWANGTPLASQKSLTEKEILKLFEEQDFALDRKLDVGEHNYGMILNKL